MYGDYFVPLLGGAYIWADHLVPILLPIAILCRFFSLPIAPFLLISQTVALGASAWIAYKISRKHLNEWSSFLIGLCFLLHPSLQNANLFEFHTFPFACFFLMLFLYYKDQHRFELASFTLFLALLCREEVAGVLLFWGLYRTKENRILGLSLASIALTWVLVAVLLKFQGPHVWANFYSTLSGKAQISTWDLVLSKVKGICIFLTAFAWFPVLGWKRFIWGLIPILYFIASPLELIIKIDYYYLVFILPFLFYASLEGLKGDSKFSHVRVPQSFKVALLLLCSILINWAYTLAPWGRSGSMKMFKDDRYSIEAKKILQQIHPHESVIAPYPVLAHLADRKWIFWGIGMGPDSIIVENRPSLTYAETKTEHQRKLKEIARFQRLLVKQFGYHPEFQGKYLNLFQRKAHVKRNSSSI